MFFRRHLRRTAFPGTARHIVPEAKRVGGQVCCSAGEQSPTNEEIGSGEDQEHPRNDMTVMCLTFRDHDNFIFSRECNPLGFLRVGVNAISFL